MAPSVFNSYGLIVYRDGTAGREFLLVCRRDSLSYLLILQGRYSPEELPSLARRVTRKEAERLLREPFDRLFSKARQNPTLRTAAAEKLSRSIDSVRGVLEAQATEGPETPEWTFPKGRKAKGESELSCAVREFHEETGVPLSALRMVSLPAITEDATHGHDGTTYRVRYFVAEVVDEGGKARQKPTTAHEVSALRWMSFEQAMRCFREHEGQKKDLLCKVNSLLDQRIRTDENLPPQN